MSDPILQPGDLADLADDLFLHGRAIAGQVETLEVFALRLEIFAERQSAGGQHFSGATTLANAKAEAERVARLYRAVSMLLPHEASILEALTAIAAGAEAPLSIPASSTRAA